MTQPVIDLEGMSAAEATERALAAIAQHDGRLHAFVEVFADDARRRAAALDRDSAAGAVRGPLHGVPISIKDLFAVAGSVTRAGSKALEQRDEHDSAAVARLRAAGAVIVGKTALHEFAMGVVTPGTNNPHDESRIAGGSSGGAAVAVASGMGVAALGSDTRGSIRIPAALCGVVGLKPTYCAVPIDDAVPLSWSLDHAGPLARSVDEAAALFAVLAGSDVAAPAPGSLRMGLPRAAWRDLDPQVDQAIASALNALAAAGIELADAQRPSVDDFDGANEISVVISRAEAVAFHRALDLDRSLYTPDVREQLADAQGILAADYVDAQRLRARLRQELLRCFDDFDVLLMPTVPIVAPPHEGAVKLSRLLTRNVALWSFVGFPALTLPCASAEGGLPVGLQLVAPPHQEAVLLVAGREVENALRATS